MLPFECVCYTNMGKQADVKQWREWAGKRESADEKQVSQQHWSAKAASVSFFSIVYFIFFVSSDDTRIRERVKGKWHKACVCMEYGIQKSKHLWFAGLGFFAFLENILFTPPFDHCLFPTAQHTSYKGNSCVLTDTQIIVIVIISVLQSCKKM